MLDLAKLLILDGRPTKELIDSLVDKAIQDLVDKAFVVMNRTIQYNHDMYKLFSLDETTESYGEFRTGCHGKHLDAVCNDIENSINRYNQFVSIRGVCQRTWGEVKGDPKAIVTISYPLLLQVTSAMKKSYVLNKELSNDLLNNDHEINHKIKI
jgi:hypothetical protein